ncbi:MAG: peptidoglycan-binding protein [Arachnia sp.]
MTSLTRTVAVAAIVALLTLGGCAPGPVTGAPGPAVSPTPTDVAPTDPAPTDSAPTTAAPTTATTTPDPTSSETPTTDPTAEPTTTEVPEPTPTAVALLKEGDEGDKVRELQHRLLQLEWWQGKITPTYGEATRLAVEGFQGKRGFPVTGEVDQQTWDKLVEMTRKPTKDEMMNILRPGPAIMERGSKGDDVKDLQARLKQIAWYEKLIDGVYGEATEAAVEGFQKKREIPVTGEVDQRTLDRLYAMTRKPTKDELNNVKPRTDSSSMTLDDRCLEGRVICISKSQRRLAWVIDGKIQDTMSVRFGSELTPTRNGVFSVYWKSRNHVSSLYHTAMPYAMFFSGGQAVHYSADFAARGYNGSSHGCVNVRDKGAVAALFDAVREGDKVVVY